MRMCVFREAGALGRTTTPEPTGRTMRKTEGTRSHACMAAGGLWFFRKTFKLIC